ncbi:DUF1616 domain-containing protein [Halobellus sp. Atlit-31R]|nr:DUF1616 domain-containing protein [Halobellus sp. Atlit-31R]
MNWERVQQNATRLRTGFLPADLLATGLFAAVAYLLVAVVSGGVLRVVAAGVLLWYLPGYVTVAALFPRRDTTDSGTRRLSLRQRAGLAIGVSLFVLVLLGLFVGAVAARFTPDVVAQTVVSYVVLGGALAALRRYRVPPRERFALPLGSWLDEGVDAVTTGSLLNRVLTVGLICSVLLAAGTFAFAAGAGSAGQPYTGFYLLTADGNGEYVSGGYPEEMTEGNATTLAYGIDNGESEPMEYVVVVTLERVVETDGAQTVIEREELDRSVVQVGENERNLRNQTVQPGLVGENLRLGFYLYRGDAPDRPDAESAYRHLHIWTTVNPA